MCLGTDGQADIYAHDPKGAWHRAGVAPKLSASPLRTLAIAQGTPFQAISLGLNDGQPSVITFQPHGGWSTPEPLPNPGKTPFSTLATTVSPDGFRHVICIGKLDGQPYLIMQDPANKSWISFGRLTNPNKTRFSMVAIGALSAGQVPAVLLGQDDGQPYLIRQQRNSTWRPVEALPNPNETRYSSMAIATGTDGYLQVICIGQDDGQPYLIWLDAVTGSWHFYGALANPGRTKYTAIATGMGHDGMLQAIFIGRDDGRLYHFAHDHNGKWGPIEPLTDSGCPPFTALATGSGVDGELLVVCLGRDDGQPYLFAEDRTTGIWSMAGKLATAVGRAAAAIRVKPTDDF
jgi:hypothetical protein